jgi:uroporphyrinogen-III decarboxylase
MMDMVERPKFVHRLFTFLCDEVIAPYIAAMRQEAGTPNLLADGNDAWASPPMISLAMMDEYVVAYTERLRSQLGDKVVTRGNWGDAESRDPERFMAQKLRCSPGFLSALDPDLFKIGAQRVKAFANKHNAFVSAGIDATLLYYGPPQAIAERIRQYIAAMATGGRFAVYLNQIPSQTPAAHIHTAVAACRTYGELPLSDNLAGLAFKIPQRESFSEFLQKKGENLI